MTEKNHWRLLARAALLGGLAIALPTAAGAADCPADQVRAGATKPGAAAPAGVTDDVLSSIELVKLDKIFKDRVFRLRRLVVQPGGVVAWHSHGARPANIYIIEGSITEYRSNCAVPIEHKAGDAIPELGADLSHWWKNNSDKPTVLISADILHMGETNKKTM